VLAIGSRIVSRGRAGRISARLLRSGVFAFATLVGGFAQPCFASNLLTVTSYGVAALSLPWAVAKQEGIIEKNGVHIDGIIGSNGGGTAVRNFLASGLPFGQIATSAAIAAIQQDIPMRFVYGAVNNVGDMAWVAPVGSPINTINDLKGKTISFTNPRSSTEMVMRLILEKTGLTNQINLISSGGQGAGLALLDKGAIAAADMDEPAIAPPGKYKVIIRVNDFLPNLTWGLGVTTPDFAKQHPDVVKGLVDSWTQSVDWVTAHPDQAAEIYAKTFATDDANAQKIVRSLINSHYFSRGALNMDGLNTLVHGMQLVGLATNAFSLDAAIDTQFLPSDMK
jgi:NitT/TauT family transport system substrate-binding protein